MDLLNCFMGASAQTTFLWRLLSAHSLNYFGLELSQPDSNSLSKGHLLLSIVANCHLEVDWSRLSPN